MSKDKNRTDLLLCVDAPLTFLPLSSRDSCSKSAQGPAQVCLLLLQWTTLFDMARKPEESSYSLHMTTFRRLLDLLDELSEDHTPYYIGGCNSQSKSLGDLRQHLGAGQDRMLNMPLIAFVATENARLTKRRLQEYGDGRTCGLQPRGRNPSRETCRLQDAAGFVYVRFRR